MESGKWYRLVGFFAIIGTAAAILVVPEVRWYLGLDALLEEYCYNGTWKESPTDQFSWEFHLDNDTLQIKRNDDFVSGNFARSGDNWIGSFQWENGTRWDNVILYKISKRCKEIKTNQKWWYRRE